MSAASRPRSDDACRCPRPVLLLRHARAGVSPQRRVAVVCLYPLPVPDPCCSACHRHVCLPPFGSVPLADLCLLPGSSSTPGSTSSIAPCTSTSSSSSTSTQCTTGSTCRTPLVRSITTPSKAFSSTRSVPCSPRPSRTSPSGRQPSSLPSRPAKDRRRPSRVQPSVRPAPDAQ